MLPQLRHRFCGKFNENLKKFIICLEILILPIEYFDKSSCQIEVNDCLFLFYHLLLMILKLSVIEKVILGLFSILQKQIYLLFEQQNIRFEIFFTHFLK